MVPSHLRDGLRRYVEEGVRTGDGLASVLRNAPVLEVTRRLDEYSLRELGGLAQFLTHYVPAGCWGSERTVDAWIERGGLQGRKVA